MTPRRRLLLAAAVVAAAGVIVAMQLVPARRGDSSADPDPGVTAADIATGKRDADKACDRFARALGQIEENDSADAVLMSLREAVSAGARAADHDPAWRPLASGLQAVQASLERNDPRAARIGVRVVRSACERPAEEPPDGDAGTLRSGEERETAGAQPSN